ncbi:hypothetical protein ACFUMH_11995 [Cellulomonas sp. NPDC057328]|uniref:hypothetical protein n=1 Tax=Cellulomonas sp. NPDC057328 TaxID=3346101 RepID=UPI00363A9F05
MLRYHSKDEGVDPLVEFDDHVPVTVTWPDYFTLEEAPTAHMCVSPGCIVEVKTRKGSSDVVELVVITARPPALQVIDSVLAPNGVKQWDEGPSLTLPSDDDLPAPRPLIFHDCFVLAWGEIGGVRWRRAGELQFGLNSSCSVLALAVPWSRAEDRAMLLGR